MAQLDVMDTFIRNVKHCLTEYGWTARDLCEATGIKEPNMSRIMSGKENVSLRRAALLAEALEIPLSQLLSETFEFSTNAA